MTTLIVSQSGSCGVQKTEKCQEVFYGFSEVAEEGANQALFPGSQ